MHEDVVRDLEYLNPWWRDGTPPAEQEHPQRLYYPVLEKMILQGRSELAVVVMGLRHTGKTHMLKQVVGKAIASGQYSPKQIVFVSGEFVELKTLIITDIVRIIEQKFVDPKKDWLLLIDEVQFFENWRQELKLIADHRPRIRCAASGSSATISKTEVIETGLGRIYQIYLPPLLFCEFLQQFRKAWPAALPTSDVQAMLEARLLGEELEVLNHEFINYINFGAFPLLAHEYKDGHCASWQELRREAHKNVVDFHVKRELSLLFGAHSSGLLHNLGHQLIENNAQGYGQQKIMKRLQTNDLTLRRYLRFLEETYFIRCFRKFDERLRILRRRHTHCRFILENCSIPSLVGDAVDADSLDMGKRVKAAALSQFGKKSPFEDYGYIDYRRLTNPFEIDLCYLRNESWPRFLAEIKWQDNNTTFEEVSGRMERLVKNWSKKNPVKSALYCTSQTSYGDGAQLCEGMRVLPAAQFSAALGMMRIGYEQI